MTEDIYIVSGNTCTVNLDVEGEYMLSCVSITGKLAITCADPDTDYITIVSNETTGTTQKKQPFYKVRSTVTSSLIPTITKFVCEKKTDGLFYYKYKITDCSDRMKYLLGIKSLPVAAGDVFQAAPSLNGPTYLQVMCDNISGCGTINHNSFIVNSLFQISGPTYIGDISNVKFAIRGIYDEDIEIDEDLLWHFQLQKLPPMKEGKEDSRTAQQKNTPARMVLQYK